MIKSSDIARYGIIGIHDRLSSVDDLFSGSHNDPELEAELMASDLGIKYYDIVYAMGIPSPRWTYDGQFLCSSCALVTQVIEFRTKEGYEAYKEDGILIFDDKGL